MQYAKHVREPAAFDEDQQASSIKFEETWLANGDQNPSGVVEVFTV